MARERGGGFVAFQAGRGDREGAARGRRVGKDGFARDSFGTTGDSVHGLECAIGRAGAEAEQGGAGGDPV